MADGFQGSDPQQLRELASRIEHEAERMADARSVLAQLVQTVEWRGPGGDLFREEWTGQHELGARAAEESLREVVSRLRANADAQERTSNDYGGGSGPGSATGSAPRSATDGNPGEGIVPVAYDPGGPPAGPPGPFGNPGNPPGQPGGDKYVVGPPTKPPISWDEDFVYDSVEPSFGDYVDWNQWGLKEKAAHLHPGLQDAADFYSHYRDNTGLPMEFDYEEAYDDDEGVRRSVDDEIANTQVGVEQLIAGGAGTEFSVTGDASENSTYPNTENWQKTIGGYQQWSSADVKVEGDQVTMTIEVHAEDHYNFNRGQNDIASKAPDDDNGKFTELGWAKPFDSSGTVTRTVTWTIGDAENATVTEPEGRGSR